MYATKRVLKVIEDVWSVDREPLTFCTRCYACKKHKFFLLSKGPRIGKPLAFCTRCHACKKHKFFLLSKGPSIGSPLLFVRGATRVKSINLFFTE
jgi:hypothetical protein